MLMCMLVCARMGVFVSVCVSVPVCSRVLCVSLCFVCICVHMSV